MNSYKKIKGEKVYLSPISLDVAETYTKWFNDRNVTDNFATSFLQITLSSEKKWIEEQAERQTHQYSIFVADGDVLVGHIGFTDVCHVHRCATVGLLIGDEANRGKGYASEALKLLLGYGFDVLNLNNVMLKVMPFNEIALGLYKKLGFCEFGRRRGAYYLNNKCHDVIFMDILRDDWYGR